MKHSNCDSIFCLHYTCYAFKSVILSMKLVNTSHCVILEHKTVPQIDLPSFLTFRHLLKFPSNDVCIFHTFNSPLAPTKFCRKAFSIILSTTDKQLQRLSKILDTVMYWNKYIYRHKASPEKLSDLMEKSPKCQSCMVADNH